MSYYKNANNDVYFLDSTEFEHLIPSDCVSITDKEAKILQSKNQAEYVASLPLPAPPTATELMVKLQALQAQIEALS